MVLCCHCGHQNGNNGNYCTFCGNRLAGDGYTVARLSVLGKAGRSEYLLADVDRYLGRELDNDVVVDDNEASARHARIWFAEHSFWVEDLNSTNGTFLNGERLAGPTGLHDDDLLKIGSTLMKFRV